MISTPSLSDTTKGFGTSTTSTKTMITTMTITMKMTGGNEMDDMYFSGPDYGYENYRDELLRKEWEELYGGDSDESYYQKGVLRNEYV